MENITWMDQTGIPRQPAPTMRDNPPLRSSAPRVGTHRSVFYTYRQHVASYHTTQNGHNAPVQAVCLARWRRESVLEHCRNFCTDFGRNVCPGRAGPESEGLRRARFERCCEEAHAPDVRVEHELCPVPP